MNNKELFKKERQAYEIVKKSHKAYEINPNNKTYSDMVKADKALKAIREMM